MRSALGAVADLVAAHGMEPEQAGTIALYLADRCGTLSLASARSSSHSSLLKDEYLIVRMDLTARQISAWLSLLRGTRPVRQPGGRLVGGFPSLVEVLARGQLGEQDQRRFHRWAHLAAGGSASRGCRPCLVPVRCACPA